MFLNLLKNNTDALELLDWDQIVSAFKSLAHFEITQTHFSAPPTSSTPVLIQNKLDQLQSAITSYDALSFAFNSYVRSVPSEEEHFLTIKFLHKERFFTTDELNFFALLFSAYRDSNNVFCKLPLFDHYIIPTSTLDNIRKNFISPLRDFVDSSGKISYEKHPVLKALYQQLLSLELELRQSIQSLAKSDLFASRLQLDNFDIIHDRYVLAIRSDSFQANLGSIISRSQSGITLFIEPFELRDKSNQRLHLLSEIESTILHLTIGLSKTLHLEAHNFDLIRDSLIDFDIVFTKATFSLKNNFSKPILSEDFHFEIRNFFHPLVSRPITNNLVLDNFQNGLILSGPNTGGKTVALKSLCLCVLFLHMGMYVPASEALIYPVTGLFYFSHDHQNIAQGLSSFSAEAKYYLSLLSNLDDTNLIFIDEIFNSTSSEEASALAMAVINEIHSISQSKIVVSTHHQMLKTFMHQRSNYVSAHVGFDLTLGAPTYKILYGEPGNSLALTIFKNLTETYHANSNITLEAQEYLDKKSLSYETLLLELSQKKIELDRLLSSQRNLEQELKNQKSSFEGVLFLEKEKILSEFNKKLKSILNNAEDLLTSIKDKKVTSKSTFFNQAANITRSIPESKQIKPYYNPYAHLIPVALENVKVGMTVFSLDFKKNVKVQQINSRKNEVQIQQGALSSWVSPDTLCYTSGVSAPRVSVHIEKTSRHEIEIDCRGMRLPEFQNTCELSIHELIAGEIPFLTIVHGHGDGVLKNWLRQFIKEKHRELRFENVEGNDGCTKISLA